MQTLSDSQKALLVLCNAPDSKTADAIAEKLIADGDAACVNIMPPCRSVYRWRDAVESETETPLFIKTVAGRLPAVQQTITALHPYEVPEIIALAVADGLPDYLQWVREACR